MTYPSHVIVTSDVMEYIKRFKLLSDLIISTGDFQKDVNEAIKTYY
jgi:hypothetical protein